MKDPNPEKLLKEAERELRVCEASLAIRKEYEDETSTRDLEKRLTLAREASSLGIVIDELEELVYGGRIEALRVRLDRVRKILAGRRA